MNQPNATSRTPGAPLRKGMAITSLVLGVLGLPTLGLLLIGALVGVVLGIVALVKANKSPDVFGGKGIAIAGILTNGVAIIIMPVVLGIIAAIAIPSFLRARVAANEAAAIGDVRTVISAETAYQSANGGFFDAPACLAAPSNCIPSYTGPTFLDPSMAEFDSRQGYTGTFHPGPAAENRPATSSPDSMTTFAYVIVPTAPGTTGIRSFCGDSTGRVCSTPSGVEPTVTDGVCDPSCVTLR